MSLKIQLPWPMPKETKRIGKILLKENDPYRLEKCLSKNMLATITIHLHLPACASLKEKRGRIKPLISRLHREFNVSVAEMDLQDKWQEAVIACAMVNSDAVTLQQSMQSVAKWVEANWEDGQIIDEKIEIV
jgi:uncharacterized protein YlxP (DUF503 family)